MKTIVTAKNHVIRHRAKYASLATAIAVVKLMNLGKEQMDEFLKEHDLYEEYYQPEN